MLEAALAYAARGWRVFPITPGAKRPLPGSHGCKDATTDPDVIRAWWRRQPNANIGVATGAGSGLVVVDLDTKSPEANGYDSLLHLEGSPAPTLQAVTPSGGLHRYHIYPGKVTGNRAAVAPGVDVRGDGGYVLAPPSQVGGFTYRWVTEPGAVDLSPCPAWVTEHRRTTPAPSAPVLDRRPGETSRYGATALDGELRAMASATEGERNTQLFKSTANLTELTEGGEIGAYSEWWEALRSAAIGTGLTAAEADRTMASGKTRDTPRRAPDLPDRAPPATAPGPGAEANTKVRWLGDGWPSFMARLREEPRPPCPTGIDALDSMLGGGLPCGRFTLLAGGPGLGKTTLAVQIAMAAARAGWPVAFASYEMPCDEIRARIVCQVTGRVSWEEVRQRQPSAIDQAEATEEHVEGLQLALFDADDVPALESLEEAVAAVAAVAGREPLLIVDYAQDLMRMVASAGEARQQAGAVGHWFRELAKRRQCPICLLSSVGRGAYSLLGKDNRPDLDRCLGVAKESGDLEYHAGAVAVLCRAATSADGPKPTWIALAKNRGGSLGSVPCKYDGLTGLFKEAEEGDMPGGATDADIDAALLIAARDHVAVSRNELCRLVRGGRAKKLERVRLLESSGRLVKRDGALRPAAGN